MSLESQVKNNVIPSALSAPALAVISKDADIVGVFEAACVAEGIGCARFKSGAKFLKKAPEDPILAVAWDERVEPPDWRGLQEAHPRATVIVVGTSVPSPAACPGLHVLNVAPDAPAEVMVNTIHTVTGWFFLERRLNHAEKMLSETESRFAESVQHSKALKEHVEFYELQRNQLSEVVRRTAYLGQLSKELNCLDLDKIVNICVTKVPGIVDATLASLYVYNSEAGELILKQSSHPYRVTDRIIPSSQPQSLMAMAMERKATLLIRDVEAFASTSNKQIDRTYAKKYATRSCIVVPLMSDNQVLAVLNLADKANGAPFDEVRDLPLVDHISQFIGIAMHNCTLYQEVWLLAKTDALTGFMNHNAFFDELHREMARAQRTGASLSLILLDVDNFKLFNDIHGHQVGDMILGQVSQIIHRNIRTVDVAARYGGDEFAIILGDTDAERAELVAERIRRAIAANQLTLDGQSFFVTISAGVAEYQKGQSLSDMVNETDAALYRAKSRGRNAVASTATPGA